MCGARGRATERKQQLSLAIFEPERATLAMVAREKPLPLQARPPSDFRPNAATRDQYIDLNARYRECEKDRAPSCPEGRVVAIPRAMPELESTPVSHANCISRRSERPLAIAARAPDYRLAAIAENASPDWTSARLLPKSILP